MAASELRVGQRVRVRPGELAPADGRVLEGRAFVDTASLTGEAEPRGTGPGSTLLAGSTVLDGALLVEVTAAPGDCVRDAVTRILEEARGRSADRVRLADRVAGALVPLVIVLASGTFVIAWREHSFAEGWQRALAVALIACPCALGIATPLAFWTALGRAWRRGVLLKGPDVLEQLARVRHVMLDKTGTLTSKRLELRDWNSIDPRLDGDAALRLAAALEDGSEHPIGAAIRRAYRLRSEEPLPRCEDFEVLPGIGVRGQVEGRALRMSRAPSLGTYTEVSLAEEGHALAHFELEAAALPGTRQALRQLTERGLNPTILSGDSWGPARALGETLGVPVEAELLPADKAQRVTAATAEEVLFVGDGLNDVAALELAGVGLVVGDGKARAMQAGDAVLLRAGWINCPR